MTEYAELIKRLNFARDFPVPSDERSVKEYASMSEEAAAAIATLLARAEKAEKPRVKALEWDRESPTEWKPETWKAESIFGEYDIQREKDGTFSGFAPNVGTNIFGTLAEAKAGAKADYDARILSALEPSS